jgi:hypothetical protein
VCGQGERGQLWCRHRGAVQHAARGHVLCSSAAEFFGKRPHFFLFFLAGRMVGSRILVGPACQSGSITTRSLPPPRLAQRCTEVPGRKRSFHIERKKWEIVHTGKPTKGRSESTARGSFPVLDCRSYKGGGTVSPGLSSPPGPDNRLQPEVWTLTGQLHALSTPRAFGPPAAATLHGDQLPQHG